jgi:ADP-ribose pyrophosphatase
MSSPTRRLIHRGVKFDLEMVSGISPSGQVFAREAIRHPGSVIVLPLRGEPGREKIVMIRNFRLSLGAWLWELPAGTMTPGEDPKVCAARELEEETGFVAATLEPICRFHPAPGLADELMHAFVARELAPTQQSLEVDERIQVEEMEPGFVSLAFMAGCGFLAIIALLTLTREPDSPRLEGHHGNEHDPA